MHFLESVVYSETHPAFVRAKKSVLTLEPLERPSCSPISGWQCRFWICDLHVQCHLSHCRNLSESVEFWWFEASSGMSQRFIENFICQKAD